MAKISEDTVRHAAAIARLSLTEKEAKKFTDDMKSILSAFSELDKIKTKESPSFQPIEIKDVMRADEKAECLSHEEAMKNAKHIEKGFFRGPKVN